MQIIFMNWVNSEIRFLFLKKMIMTEKRADRNGETGKNADMNQSVRTVTSAYCTLAESADLWPLFEITTSWAHALCSREPSPAGLLDKNAGKSGCSSLWCYWECCWALRSSFEVVPPIGPAFSQGNPFMFSTDRSRKAFGASCLAKHYPL